MRPGVAVMISTGLSAVLTGCSSLATQLNMPVQPSALSPSRIITDVSAKPKTMDVRTQEVVTIQYELTQSSDVTLHLVDDMGVIVRTLEAGRQSAGVHTLSWDGRSNEGTAIVPGVYRYIILASGPTGLKEIYDPSKTTGGEELTPRDFTFDRATGTCRWVMPKTGYARLRIGLQGFPHLRTLMDWIPLEAGMHELVWDGRDASGLIQLREHPNLSINLSAFALPHNTLIVKHAPPDTAETTDGPVYQPLFRAQASAFHARHARQTCHEPRLSVEFPGVTSYDAQGRPVVWGVTPVRVTLNPQDAVHLVNVRFEVALFEDTTFLFEEEDGTNPYTYAWDTSRLVPGEHKLTVNVLSYDDHYGVMTVPVVIKRQP